jgi:tetratricopeptide (TPR) repeat protein
MLGSEDSAIADCEIALHENPSDESALPIKALAHLHAQQFDEAIASFEKITDNEAKKRNLIPQATAYNAAKKPEKVVGLLKPYWEASPNNPDQIKIADQLLWAYSQSGNAAEANKVIEKLQSTWAKNSEALSAIAHYRKQQGKNEEAIGLYSEALAYPEIPDNCR